MERTNRDAPSRSHRAFSVTLNIALIGVYFALVLTLMAICRPPVPLWFPLLGAFLGGCGGFLQHLSLKRDYNRFGAASSRIEIRRRLNETRAGKLYLYYFWGINLCFVLLAFGANSSPITAFAALTVAYFSFAILREIVTLRDVFAMARRSR